VFNKMIMQIFGEFKKVGDLFELQKESNSY